MKWSFVGDLQIPYHDPRAVELYMKAMKWWKPDAIDIVGDIDDQLEYSSFSDGTTDEFFNQLKKNDSLNEKKEIERQKLRDKIINDLDSYDDIAIAEIFDEFESRPVDPLPFVKENALGAREFYTAVRKQHKNADIHASLGNHEMRVFKYMDRKAPEYVESITPDFLYDFGNLGITYRMYTAKPLERFAGIHVHHGNTTTATGLAVRGDIENYGISLVRGHDHRGGVVYKSYPMTGNSLVGMGTGHLCDADAYGLQYADNPAWEQGFGIAYVYDNKAHLQFIPIRNTDEGLTCVLDGKKFTS